MALAVFRAGIGIVPTGFPGLGLEFQEEADNILPRSARLRPIWGVRQGAAGDPGGNDLIPWAASTHRLDEPPSVGEEERPCRVEAFHALACLGAYGTP